MNDYANYLSGINAVQSQPQDPGTSGGGPSFWQNLMAAASRAGSAGGGLAGLAAALSPSFAAGYNRSGMDQNRPIQMGNTGAGMGNTGAAAGNAQAASSASGGLSKLGGMMGGMSF